MTSRWAAPVRRRGTALAAAVLGAALLAAGCSSSPSSSPTTSPSATPPAAAPPTSSAAALSCPSTPPAVTVAPNLTGTEAAVATAWESFFSPSVPLAQKPCYLQNGAQLESAFTAFAANTQAAGFLNQLSAKVTAVAVNGQTATVTYDLLLGPTPAEPNASGTAVLENGSWKVSLSHLCSLLTLAKQTGITIPVPPQCNAAPSS